MSSARRSSSSYINKCGKHALQQRSGTCWLNTSLNMLLLSSNIYKDLLYLYAAEGYDYNEEAEKRFTTILTSQSCPIYLSRNTARINRTKDYIFALIYQTRKSKLFTERRFTPIDQLAWDIKYIEDPENIQEEGFSTLVTIPYIFKLLYTDEYYSVITTRRELTVNTSKKYLIINKKLIEIPLKNKLHNYSLEAAAIEFETTPGSNDYHVITYFRCNNNCYIFDSNDTKIHTFKFDLDNITDIETWKEHLIKMYASKQINVNYTCNNPQVVQYIYRQNEESSAPSTSYSYYKYILKAEIRNLETILTTINKIFTQNSSIVVPPVSKLLSGIKTIVETRVILLNKALESDNINDIAPSVLQEERQTLDKLNNHLQLIVENIYKPHPKNLVVLHAIINERLRYLSAI